MLSDIGRCRLPGAGYRKGENHRSQVTGHRGRIFVQGREVEGAFLAADGDVRMEGAGVGELGMASTPTSNSAFLLLVVEVAEALVAHGG